MNIIGTSYTLQHKSFDIYVAGCSGSPHCDGCHNPESWNFNQGIMYDKDYFNKIKYKVNLFDSMVENIMIFGGEPLDQDHKYLIQLLTDLRTLNKKVWLFTRYEIKEVPQEIKLLCDFIKTGRYKPDLATEDNIQCGIKLASSNQQIHNMEEQHD
jgi:anaerobic ribonucleoside-triphosphate reductase activating protein